MKMIVLSPGKPPKLVGTWTVGQALQMAQALAAHIESLQLQTEQPLAPPPVEDDGDD